MRNLLLIQVHRTRAAGLVIARSGGGWRIQRDVCVPLAEAENPAEPGAPSDNWALRMRRALGARNTPQACALLLHRREYALLQMELPPGTPEEIAAMLELNLGERLPADLAAVCYGWETTGGGDGQERVQVYWTPQNRVAPVLESLKGAGFTLAGIFPALAVLRPFCFSPGAEHPVALLHASSEAVELAAWTPDGRMPFSRGLQSGETRTGSQCSADTGLLRELAAQVRENPDRLGMAENAPLGVVFLKDPEAETPACPAGLRPEEHPAAPRLAESAAQCRSGTPGEFLSLAALAESAEPLFSQSGSGHLSNPLNMLPRSTVRGRKQARTRSLATQVALLIAGIVVLGSGNLWLYAHQLEKTVEANMAEITRLTPQAKEIEAMQQRIASIRDQIDYAMTPADALRHVNAVLASSSEALAGLYLDRMSYKASGQIVMEGHAVSDITPWKFADSLDEAGMFRILQRPRIETHMLGGTRSIRFALTVQAGTAPASASAGREVKP